MNPIAQMPPLAASTVERFRAIVGDRYALSDPVDVQPYVVEDRNLFSGYSPLVLRPGSTAEVAAICRVASETQTAIVPQGGNTGLVGGQMPIGGEVILSLRRLDKIREIDTSSNTVTAEAGVILQTLQHRAVEADRLFPLSLGSEGSCTLGGNLSSNAGGTAALAFGVARDLALGLEVVLADGRILNGLSKLKKDNTGYDLRNIFIGAEGTLGIITAATMKLFPRPRSVECAFVGLRSPSAALELFDLARTEATASLTSFELIASIAVEFGIRHGNGHRNPLAKKHNWYVLMEVTSAREGDARNTLETILEQALGMGVVDDAVIADSIAQRKAMWRLREELSECQKPEGGSIKQDISVPVAAVPTFLSEADKAVAKLIPGARPVSYGHLGDGNIHYNVSQPANSISDKGAKDAFLARWHDVSKAVFEVVARHGGSISAEHGIGQLKLSDLPGVKDPVAMELMYGFKAMLDPLNILNPCKVILSRGS